MNSKYPTQKDFPEFQHDRITIKLNDCLEATYVMPATTSFIELLLKRYATIISFKGTYTHYHITNRDNAFKFVLSLQHFPLYKAIYDNLLRLVNKSKAPWC